jgi:hypothetical protein
MSVPSTSSQPIEKPGRPAWLIALVLFILAVVPLWHLHVINRAMPPNKADLVAVWKGTQAAFHGQNPYLNATTVEIQRFYYGRSLRPTDNVNPMAYAYPMHTVLLFAPIAWMPWTAVRITFLILLPLFTAISVIIWYRVTEIRSTNRHLALVVFISLCSWPTMWAVHQIQPSIIVALLVAMGCWTLQRGKPAVAGILFALATIKPQLIAVLLAWLFLWAALRRIWNFFIAFGLTVGALLAVSFRMLPGWVADWRKASAEYAVYRHLQLDLQDVFGHVLGLIVTAVLALVVFAILWRNRRCQPHSREFGLMCALALAVTLCVLPTELAMVYNHVLLFPACFLLFETKPSDPKSYSALTRRIALGLLLWSFASMDLAVIGETLLSPSGFWDALPCQTHLLSAAIVVAILFPLLEQKRLVRAPKLIREQQPA